MKVCRALISVSDKADVATFAKALSEMGVEIISTGGTAKALSGAGVKIIQVSDYTGFPEMLDGRVKTLHPKVEAGILAVRSNKEHMSQLQKHGIPMVDLVCVNLYPFKKTVDDPKSTLDDAIENIDVGGPTLVRAAAKNFSHVTVIVDPKDYGRILAELHANGMRVSDHTRRHLAMKAFAHTAEYDAQIHSYLSGKLSPGVYPERLNLTFKKVYDLRYGENPHQTAAFYSETTKECSIPNGRVVSEGKKLSFNNIIDANAALELVKEFETPVAAIIKHLNPSGVAKGEDIASAYALAHSADPKSAYGCVVALNREMDEKTAEDVASTFVEVVIAPSYSKQAVKALSQKKNMRLIEVGEIKRTTDKSYDLRRVVGGLLIQSPDSRALTENDLKTVTERAPTKDEVEAMLFAWTVCRHTKSNSIIFSQKDRTVGVGAGQMSRVDAVRIAAMKAGSLADGAAMASDAFFPFRDGIDEAAKAGIKAVIHPGGSIRDEEVVKAANEHGMAMAYTGVRCFLH